MVGLMSLDPSLFRYSGLGKTDTGATTMEPNLYEQVSEAVGKADALMCAMGAMGALVATLAEKKVLTADEIATLGAEAAKRLEDMKYQSDDAKKLASACLRGLSR